MSQFKDYEAQLMSAMKGPKFDVMSCKTCKCEWFEQVSVTKFDNNTVVAPNQRLPERFWTFTLLKCAHCGNLQEIPVNSSGWDRAAQEHYNKMLDELQKPLVKPDVKA